MEQVEVAILGAGPGGLSAATNAAHHGIPHILIEKREVGNTVFDYQLRKHVMAEPAKLPLRAKVGFRAGTREQVLEGWNAAVRDHGVNLQKGEVNKVERQGDGFVVSYSGKQVRARHVVLAIGCQGSPRKLGVPGEDHPHVAYTLSDPDAFSGRDIIVVGAGDAAIENALALSQKNRVVLINRSDEFSRAKDGNAAAILAAIQEGSIRCFYNTTVARIEPEQTYLTTPEGEAAVPCSHLIARLGAIPPRKFMEGCGIVFPSVDPAAVPAVNARYESNVPGLFIIGALIGYPLIKQCINQGFEVVEHIRGNAIEPADQPLIIEKLQPLGAGEVSAHLALLRNALPLFRDLSEPQFREFVLESTIHRKRPSEVVFERNDYTDTFFSVVAGTVGIELPQGGTVTIPAGNFFGEMGLLSGRRRSATIRVVGEAILMETPRKQMLKLMSSVESVKRTIDEAFVLRAMETSIFPGVSRAALTELLPRLEMRRFKKGEVLFREGDAGDLLYVIRKGSVKVLRKNPAGRDVAQTYIPAGNFVGEMALLRSEPTPRSATVVAAVACETVVVKKADFLGMLATHPDVADRVRKIAEARQIENVTQSLDEQGGSVREFFFQQGVTDADNILLIDSDRCVGCDNCEKACAATHNGYSRLDRKGGKSFASVQIPISCRHCENPLCMVDCPPDALTRQPDGEVVIRDSCIGCGNCVRNCPYGVIQLVYDKPSDGFSLLGLIGLGGTKSKEKGAAKAAKCDLCHSLAGGPACVRSCPTGAAMRVSVSAAFSLIGRGGAR